MLESLETLIGTGGEETNKLMFRLESPEEVPIALRFDLTVPFARLLAQYPDKLKPPVRRYHVGPVFRADKPDPGRFRQFTQFDIDAAGSESVAVDAEIIAAMCEAFRELGIGNYRVLISNRKLVDALLEDCGISDVEVQKHVLRVVDKLQKIGLENVRRELGEGRKDEESGAPIPGVGLDETIIDKITRFIYTVADSREVSADIVESAAHEEQVKPHEMVEEKAASEAGSRKTTVDALRLALPDSDQTREALAEMEELAEALDALGVAEAQAVFDPSLTRGLDYYTGPVFEMVLPDAPEFGSVGGGGRYNRLVERFLETPIPATGMSIGVDRLLTALEVLGVARPSPSVTEVIIMPFPGVRPADSLQLAMELRRAGIAAEVYFGKARAKLKQQLSYANAKGIPVAVIIGEDEIKSGTVSVKDLREGKKQRADIADHDKYKQAGKSGQQTIPRTELVDYVKSLRENQ